MQFIINLFTTPIETVQIKEVVLPCENYASAQELAKALITKDYFFAKPVYQFEVNKFKWKVIKKQAEFVKIEKGTQPQFYPLIMAIKEVADTINSDYMRIKLNKLIVALCETKSWPFTEKTKVEDTAKVFVNFKNLKDPHYDIDRFADFVRLLNRELREHSMTLQTIAEKIATKGNRPMRGGKKLYGRVLELVQMGIKRIEKNPFDPTPTLLFCRVFSYHTHIYHENSDNLQAQTDLKKSVNLLMRTLRKCDDSTFLLQFFSELLTTIEKFSKINPDICDGF